MRFTLFLAAFFAVCGLMSCNQQAQSQEAIEPVSPGSDFNTVAEANSSVLLSRQNAITRAVELASPAVVSINVIGVERFQYQDPFAGDPWMEYFFGRRRSRIYERQVQAVGSGFVISPDGYIVTNEHVAHNAAQITVAFMDGATLEAQLVGRDEATDLALLKVDTTVTLPYLNFAEEGNPIPGEWVIALGNPFGLFEAAEPTVTVGVISGVGRDFQPQENRVYRDMIQTDAAINKGNSGGPLINALGEVIGVNTFIYTAGRNTGSIGLGFAVPAYKAREIVNELRTNGEVDRSYYTGLRGLDVNDRIARALGLTETRGFIVRDVDPSSPAEDAGFRPYDVILSFEGEAIDGQLDLAGRLYDFRPGDTVQLQVMRDARMINLSMTLGRQG